MLKQENVLELLQDINNNTIWVLSFCMTVALVALLNNNSAQGIVFWGQQ
jgi:hypothetical protein